MPTEREKMLAGELYLGADPELVALRVAARDRTARLNALAAAAPAGERDALLAELFAAAGPGCWVEPPFRCDYGSHITLGRGVYLNFDCVILDCAAVTVGDGAKFGPGVHVYTAHHPTDPTARRLDPRELATPVTIGANVWVGGRAVLLPGVTVGADTVIGAGSVVTRSLPAGVVAAGVPCRVVRAL